MRFFVFKMLIVMSKCRLCLVTSKGSCSISDLRDDKSFKFMITSIANIKIEEDDGITDKICLICSKKVIDAYNLKTQILRSNEILQESGCVKKIFFNNLDDIKIKCHIEMCNIIPKLGHSFSKLFNVKDYAYLNSTIIRKINVDIAGKNKETPLEDFEDQIINNIDNFQVDDVLYNDDISRSDEYEDIELYDQPLLHPVKSKKLNIMTKLEGDKFKRSTMCKSMSTMKTVLIKPVFLRDIKICHKATNYAENNFKHVKMCNFCGVMTKSINRHILKHTGKTQRKTYKCDLCGKCFLVRSYLKKHLNTHSGDKNIKCDICNAGFSDRMLLKSHLVSHSKERKFICSICNKKFKRNDTLKRHIISHNSCNRNITCDHCNMTFFTKCKLKHHLRVHTGERPYNCEICSQAYSYKHDFNRHCLNKHGVFLKRRSVFVMNEEVRQRERALMQDLVVNIKRGNPLNPFEGPQGVLAFQQVIKAVEKNIIPLDMPN